MRSESRPDVVTLLEKNLHLTKRIHSKEKYEFKKTEFKPSSFFFLFYEINSSKAKMYYFRIKNNWSPYF